MYLDLTPYLDYAIRNWPVLPGLVTALVITVILLVIAFCKDHQLNSWLKEHHTNPTPKEY